MTIPAPYDRDTLNRIRLGARACDLGWPDDRYHRICRHHGIEPRAVASIPAPMSSEPVHRGDAKDYAPRTKGKNQTTTAAGQLYVTAILPRDMEEWLRRESEIRGIKRARLFRMVLGAVHDLDLLPLLLKEDKAA